MFQYGALLVLSVILFLYGFFPISNNISTFPNDPPVIIGDTLVDITQTYKPHFQKTILIVIDALRWDFATEELMPQTIEFMNNKGCLSKVLVESPTVTLPRIKALTTGSIPQYIDMIKNLASSEILSDSWLHSARDKGLKTVFYGDNTWEKLFPNFFTRSEGTTSFFVWDFIEVDDNVTRNVEVELERTDWDIMVLHYLGLDHIGHALGPFSSKMPSKLKEMDDIITKIHKKTNHNDTLIMVTGDHGMRDGGGHGGTSQPEIIVPLITIGHNCQSSSFLQTDIPANIAILLGLNIPTTSIGKIQREFLNNLNLQQYLYALRYNTEILLSKKEGACKDSFVNATNFHEKYLKEGNKVLDAQIAIELYQKCAQQITEDLYKASSKQDMSSLALAVLIMSNLLMSLLIGASNKIELMVYTPICLMQIFWAIEGVALISVILGLIAVLMVKLKGFSCSLPQGTIQIYLFIICLLHPLTFISTSFIEEEHYYWTYSSVTLILLLAGGGNKVSSLAAIKLIVTLICLRFAMDLNSTVENSVQKNDNWANILATPSNYLYHQCFLFVGLSLVFATICWEQNGIKSHNYLLHLLSFFAVILIFLLKTLPYHASFLAKLIWGFIFTLKLCFAGFSWKQFWILASALLIKSHNVVLICFATWTANQINGIVKNVPTLTIANYMLSNCFYFLQGHRNSLANVDISIGYTGLNDYYPLIVVSQLLIHTYTFPVLFHWSYLERVSDRNQRQTFWKILLTLRASVVLLTSIVMILFKHHLFIWSVFAPKFFIESVHTAFLFIEVCFWYFQCIIKRLLLACDKF